MTKKCKAGEEEKTHLCKAREEEKTHQDQELGDGLCGQLDVGGIDLGVGNGNGLGGC
jgi:hypothetical protein